MLTTDNISCLLIAVKSSAILASFGLIIENTISLFNVINLRVPLLFINISNNSFSVAPILIIKFTNEFKIVLNSLEKAGYNNYWKILNATEYGIPQDRDRVFIVSIRKDIDHNIFNFPKPYNLEKRLEDILEQTVDEKYFLTNDLISKIVRWKAQQKPFKRVLGKKSIPS